LKINGNAFENGNDFAAKWFRDVFRNVVEETMEKFNRVRLNPRGKLNAIVLSPKGAKVLSVNG
jgi:hypothetical protein